MVRHRRSRGLQRLIGAALTDDAIRLGLLNGDREQIVDRYPLSERERRAILTVKADTLTSLAAGIVQLTGS